MTAAARSRRDGPDVHLNLNVRGLPPSATLAINERSNALLAEGRAVYKLGLGQSPFPVPDPVVEALRLHAHEKDYLPVQGLPALREGVAAYHNRTDGLRRVAEDVLIGPGSKELMFLLQLVYHGELLVPTPAWVSYAPQAQIIGRPVHWIETRPGDGWRITPEDLEATCAAGDGPRLLILNYPSNPHGGTYTRDELKALAGVCRAHKILVLSDEIYGELHFAGRHVSIARFYPEGTIISSGLSKWCGAGGWRVGTFTFPSALRWLLQAMAAVASETYTSTSAPIQHAAVRAFEGGTDIEQYLWRSRRILSAIAKHMHAKLTAVGADVVRPKGGFYIFPSFEPLRDRLVARGITDGAELTERLLDETGVAILPGAHFGRPAGELSARIAFVNFDGARALAAAEHVVRQKEIDDAFLLHYCWPTLTAIDALCDWVQT
ncbi:MAG: aminotransferase class I/II-fold pyridoxal phosphate-dependent enzyme [Sandaracinaceae bacterium]|nr:aminotransferase class I/II-fold pyridoxal phosphate-dependent enzyme [Sandaracinaceae bacterium]